MHPDVQAMKGFPDPPKKKVICGGKFCIVIMLQMVAELNLEGTLTGTLEVSTEADFEIAGTVRVTSSFGLERKRGDVRGSLNLTLKHSQEWSRRCGHEYARDRAQARLRDRSQCYGIREGEPWDH